MVHDLKTMLTPAEISQQHIPTIADVDLLIIGGGTAGAVAAIAGGREGLRTLVVEQMGFLGGTQTGALVTPMMPNQIDGEPLNGGIDLEINHRLNLLHESGVWMDGNRGWFNPEFLKHLLDQMVLETGSKILFNTMFEDAVLDQNTVVGAVVVNKAGRGFIKARRTIDASGDGDVSFKAGVTMEQGDPDTGRNQPFSVRFHLGNVDLRRFADFLRSLGKHDVMDAAEGTDVMLIHTAMVWGKGWTLESVFRKAVDDGVLKERDGDYFQVFTMAGRPGELAFNCPRIREDVDGTNPEHLTNALIKGREIIRRYVTFCQEYLPGCEQAYLVMSAPMVGVRESRRIRGEYYLTTDEVLSGAKFPDGILRNNYPLDVHRDPQDQRNGVTKLPEGEYHEVPYRCLVPVGVDGLLVAGRCLSASFEAQSSIRVQSNCRAMGEAAALAAAMSIRSGISLRNVDGVELRAELKRRGARL